MKPAAVVLVLSLGILSGGAPARAEGPWQYAEPSPLPSPFEISEHADYLGGPWTPRPPIAFEGADLWSDYRGACIEHDLYRPRFLASSGTERRPLLSAVGNWLDGLFAWTPPSRHDDCPYCDPTGTGGDTDRLPGSAQFDAPPGARRAPLLAPVPLPEAEPWPRVQPAPVPPTPVQIVPVEPGAAPPAPAVQPPANVIPKLTPPRGPIVEFAPEPALPPEQPTPAIPVPRNRVPRPGQQLPRNAIPR